MDSSLERLLNKTLTTVDFVMGYVNLNFENVVLSALALPIVVNDAGSIDVGHSDYRDALDSQIGKVVSSTTETDDKLEVRFKDGPVIVVPLDAETPPGPEMATLSGSGHFYRAWLRTGQKK